MCCEQKNPNNYRINKSYNIKNVVLEHDNSKFNIEFLVLDFRRAGAVLKGDVQKVKQLLASANESDMARMVAEFKRGKVNVGEFTNLDSSLFTVSTKPKEEFVIANDENLTVVLDVTIDRELMLEGLSRELIRTAQVLRKEANFNVEDRIYIDFETDSKDLNEIINKFSDKIKAELLALDYVKMTDPEIEEECEIADEKITIKMKRAKQ